MSAPVAAPAPRGGRGLRLALAAGGALAVALWTLAALAAWWLLQAAAGALDAGSTAAAMQAVTAWTERPWVRHWLDPDEAAALRDGIDWLMHLGGGPAAWLGTAMALLAAALLIGWAGGLVLAALAVWATLALLRRGGAWWREARGKPWRDRGLAPGASS